MARSEQLLRLTGTVAPLERWRHVIAGILWALPERMRPAVMTSDRVPPVVAGEPVAGEPEPVPGEPEPMQDS